ncbi:MAG: TIGR03013 family PEP-CTERM/XrtA system glycosyltransferase [Desulfobacteraceae bacterium]|nr:TIGR03013 family PEP-CTERM/XrtA system glycosyltransferase [Desulfobacteraceae bacterium]
MLRLFKQYYPVRNAVFVLGEGIFIFFSVVFACYLLKGIEAFAPSQWTILKALLITIICQICLYYNDLYDLAITDTLVEMAVRLMQALGVAAILLAIVYFVFPDAIIGEGIFVVSVVFVIVLIVSWRIAYSFILNRGMFNQKIMIMGSSDIAKEIYLQIQDKKDSGYEVSSIISRMSWEILLGCGIEMICQSKYENVCEIAKSKDVKKIIIALKEKRNMLPITELLKCRIQGIDVLDGNSFYEMLTGKLIVESINPGWLIFSHGFQKTIMQKLVKRCIDLVLSATMLIIFFPIMAIVAILIKIESKGPVIFSQERVGENRKQYMVHKFRSMRYDAEKHTGPIWAQKNDDRITKVGYFIRKWRIDEIPQLWNVLKGEMSFVGPRPEREHFVKKLEDRIPYYNERLSVKPGLTGWAQVSYGYGSNVEDAVEKLNYELFYVKNMSIIMDLMIVARTVKTVIFGHGR